MFIKELVRSAVAEGVTARKIVKSPDRAEGDCRLNVAHAAEDDAQAVLRAALQLKGRENLAAEDMLIKTYKILIYASIHRLYRRQLHQSMSMVASRCRFKAMPSTPFAGSLCWRCTVSTALAFLPKFG